MPYRREENGFQEHGDAAAYTVAYVRPETNNVLYERAILSGLRAHGTIIYCANINGSVFRRDKILERHYPTQFRFARDPRRELAGFPEIASRLERHFRCAPSDANLLGSFDAVRALGISEEDLLETIVPPTDFISCWGQSFKRIRGAIVVNPNLPAIVKRHASAANVFAVVARCLEATPAFFHEVNRRIFTEITARAETPVIDGEKLDALDWSEKIRRTFHLSVNHLMAMLDMSDFVYTADEQRLDVADTPLGKWLIAEGAVTSERLLSMKGFPLLRRRDGDGQSLVYLPTAAGGMAPREVLAMMRGG